jgi:hypothetical protein
VVPLFFPESVGQTTVTDNPENPIAATIGENQLNPSLDLTGEPKVRLMPKAAGDRPRLARGIAAVSQNPTRATLILICITALLRVGFGAMLGLGIDESYVVATARVPQLSYFDHPPLVWWLVKFATQILANDQPLTVRLPFILLFSLSTWLLFRLTATLFGATAGFYAAALLNLSPVFGLVVGSWVLPDGPLDCALLGAAICFVHAVRRDNYAHFWWLGLGVCAGLAMLSKYMALIVLIGIPFVLLTDHRLRMWFRRPEPYLALAIAVVLCVPVLQWNENHAWASLIFQGGRAAGMQFHPWGPIVTITGECSCCRGSDYLCSRSSLTDCGVGQPTHDPGYSAVWLQVRSLSLPLFLSGRTPACSFIGQPPDICFCCRSSGTMWRLDLNAANDGSVGHS